jgi:hypothetical protein
MRRYLCRSVLCALAVLIVGPAAAAQARPTPRLVPVKVVHGIPGGALLGESFRPLYESTTGQTPCLALGRRGEILGFGPGSAGAVCTVKPGTPILIAGFSASCSDFELAPFAADLPEAQRACALKFLQASDFDPAVPDPAFSDLVSIDGGPQVQLQSPAFLLRSPALEATGVEGALFVERNAGEQGTFAVAGYAALLRPLPPGTYEVSFETIFAGTLFEGTVTVRVVPPGRGRGR